MVWNAEPRVGKVGTVDGWQSKRTFEGGGLTVSGPEGLDLMSISCRMSSPVPSHFRGRVLTLTLGDIRVGRTRVQHLVSVRTPETLDDFYSDHLQIMFPVKGRIHIEHQGRSVTAEAGQVATIFPGDLFTTTFSELTEVVQFYLPTHHLAEQGLSPREVSARAWGASPLGAAARQFLLELTGPWPATTPATTHVTQPAFISRALTEMGLGLLNELRDERPPLGDVREATRVRVRALIAGHAHDPDLNVDGVAAHIGASRRYLQGLFTEASTGVGELIRSTRLQHAARSLTNRPDLSIGRVAAAAGFRGPDQLSRAFQSAYGLTPSEFRRRNLPISPAPAHAVDTGTG